MALSPGVNLGPYEIESVLNACGNGRDTRLDRTVAVQVLAAQLSSSGEVKACFEREAPFLGSLNYPHICRLYDNDTSKLASIRLPGKADHDGPS
ncbi:MAG TPA: hypothetical protein VEI52_08590 [Terriglobales bacterium]|nr:hypothetical protein [Terriglobales bacterium]